MTKKTVNEKLKCIKEKVVTWYKDDTKECYIFTTTDGNVIYEYFVDCRLKFALKQQLSSVMVCSNYEVTYLFF